jgi:serine phosphatase RsbU (regulator of sigma subunit)
MELQQFDKAMTYFMNALEIRKKMNNPHGVSETYTNIATNYLKQKNYQKAREYFLLAIPICEEIGSKESLKYVYENLYQLEQTLKNTAAAFDYYKLYISYKDSIDNTDHARVQTELELNYNYDKEKERIRLLQEKKEERATIILYSVVGVLFLILVFSFLLYKRWKYAQQQQAIIEEKNELVQQKNDEILDSINYAKRIQTAILPSSEQISALFPNHFVTFFPKDIVAGDFYWIEETPNHIFIAGADCTGHGVPGAMMSVVCHNALNRSVKEFQLTMPGEILDKTREIIIDELSKSEQQVKDGMDISLCVIDRQKKEMRWAGANNPLWVYRTDKKELEEWKGDKQPIGSHWDLQPFTSHAIAIHPNDRFYLFSDGYVDQFGGPHGKKLMSKVFKQLILDSAHMDLASQRHYLETYFNDWKGDLPQVDDVCVICIML